MVICKALFFKFGIILRTISKIHEHISEIMGTAQKNNAQLYWHKGLVPSS